MAVFFVSNNNYGGRGTEWRKFFLVLHTILVNKSILRVICKERKSRRTAKNLKLFLTLPFFDFLNSEILATKTFPGATFSPFHGGWLDMSNSLSCLSPRVKSALRHFTSASETPFTLFCFGRGSAFSVECLRNTVRAAVSLKQQDSATPKQYCVLILFKVWIKNSLNSEFEMPKRARIHEKVRCTARHERRGRLGDYDEKADVNR